MRVEHVWSEATVRATRRLDARRARARHRAARRREAVDSRRATSTFPSWSAAARSVRSYSLVGDWSPARYRIAVKRQPQGRGGSAYMWSLEPGARLTVGAPNNRFELAARQSGLSPRGRRRRRHADCGHGAEPGRARGEFPRALRRPSRAPISRWPTRSARRSAIGSRSSYPAKGVGSTRAPRSRGSAREASSICAGRSGWSRIFAAPGPPSGGRPSRFRVETFGSSGAFAPRAVSRARSRTGRRNRGAARSLDAGRARTGRRRDRRRLPPRRVRPLRRRRRRPSTDASIIATSSSATASAARGARSAPAFRAPPAKSRSTSAGAPTEPPPSARQTKRGGLAASPIFDRLEPTKWIRSPCRPCRRRPAAHRHRRLVLRHFGDHRLGGDQQARRPKPRPAAPCARPWPGRRCRLRSCRHTPRSGR